MADSSIIPWEAWPLTWITKSILSKSFKPIRRPRPLWA